MYLAVMFLFYIDSNIFIVFVSSGKEWTGPCSYMVLPAVLVT